MHPDGCAGPIEIVGDGICVAILGFITQSYQEAGLVFSPTHYCPLQSKYRFDPQVLLCIGNGSIPTTGVESRRTSPPVRGQINFHGTADVFFLSHNLA